jgi:hypothetical protein
MYGLQVAGTLLGCVLVVALPLALGLVLARLHSDPLRLGLLCVVGCGSAILTLMGLSDLETGRALGTGDPSMAGLGHVIGGYFLTFVGIVLTFVGLGLALGRERRLGRGRGFLALTLATGVPVLATLALFCWDILVVEHFPGATPAGYGSELLAFRVAPIGGLAIAAYGLGSLADIVIRGRSHRIGDAAR